MTPSERRELWDAINEYALACMPVRGFDERRTRAIARVERVVDALLFHCEICGDTGTIGGEPCPDCGAVIDAADDCVVVNESEQKGGPMS